MTPALLQRIAAGDESAVQACIDQYGGLVWSLARRSCRHGTDAEDAVQEIFIELWTHARRFDPSLASEATFVSMVARRRLIDRLRRRERRPAPEPMTEAADVPVPPPPDRLEERDELERVADALAELSEAQQRVLRLAVYDGMSQRSIAERLELPLGTVKTHIRRGLIRIREVLGAVSAGEVAR